MISLLKTTNTHINISSLNLDRDIYMSGNIYLINLLLTKPIELICDIITNGTNHLELSSGANNSTNSIMNSDDVIISGARGFLGYAPLKTFMVFDSTVTMNYLSVLDRCCSTNGNVDVLSYVLPKLKRISLYRY